MFPLMTALAQAEIRRQRTRLYRQWTQLQPGPTGADLSKTDPDQATRHDRGATNSRKLCSEPLEADAL